MAKSKKNKKSIRTLVIEKFKAEGRSYTADEMADALQRNILSVRPIFTQLKQQGVIYDSYVSVGRCTKLGSPATVYYYCG